MITKRQLDDTINTHYNHLHLLITNTKNKYNCELETDMIISETYLICNKHLDKILPDKIQQYFYTVAKSHIVYNNTTMYRETRFKYKDKYDINTFSHFIQQDDFDVEEHLNLIEEETVDIDTEEEYRYNYAIKKLTYYLNEYKKEYEKTLNILDKLFLDTAIEYIINDEEAIIDALKKDQIKPDKAIIKNIRNIADNYIEYIKNKQLQQ